MNFISTFDELNKIYDSVSLKEAAGGGFRLDGRAMLDVEELADEVWRNRGDDTYIKKYLKNINKDISVDDLRIAADESEYSRQIKSLIANMERNGFKTIGDFAKSFEAIKESEDKTNVEEGVLGTALAVGAGALAGTALGNALSEDAESEEDIEVEDDEADVTDTEDNVEEIPAEEDSTDEAKQTIIECSKCGALVIVDEVVVDEATDLVNVKDVCKFCEEKEGYKIVGSVIPYEVVEIEVAANDEEASEEIAEEPVEEAVEVKEVLDFNIPVSVTANDNEVAVGGLTSGK